MSLALARRSFPKHHEISRLVSPLKRNMSTSFTSATALDSAFHFCRRRHRANSGACAERAAMSRRAAGADELPRCRRMR